MEDWSIYRLDSPNSVGSSLVNGDTQMCCRHLLFVLICSTIPLGERIGDAELLLRARYPTLFWIPQLTGEVDLETHRTDFETAGHIADRPASVGGVRRVDA